MRKLVRAVPNNSTFLLSTLGLDRAKIEEVWSSLDPNIDEQNVGQVRLTHLVNAYFEEVGHDWAVFHDVFRFQSHSSVNGRIHDLIIVYSEKGE